MRVSRLIPMLLVAAAVLLTSASGFAATVPILGTAQDFSVLGASTVTNTGATTLTGLLGVYPGTSITGQSTITINGQPALTTGSVFVHQTDAVAQQAQADVSAAYTALAGLSPTATLTGQDLGNMVLTPGVYFFADSAQLTGALTLDGQGLDNPYWVFQIGSTLTTASGSSVVAQNFGSNNGSDAGVFWQVGSTATLGTSTAFQGNILALASVTLNTTATIDNGRAFALTAAVTMDTNTISNLCFNNLDAQGNPGLGFSGGLGFDTVTGELVAIESSAGPEGTVPEPLTLGGLALGLGTLGRYLCRRKRAASTY